MGAGEETTAAVLGELPYGWTVLRDARRPGRRRTAVGHVVIGPGGVFAIDSVAWSGAVTVDDGALRHGGRPRDQELGDVARAALAVSGVIGNVPVVPVLCVVRHEPVAGWAARDVMVCSTGNLVQMLTSRPTTLQPATISRLLPVLVRQLDAAGDRVAPEARGPRPPRRPRARRAPRPRRTPRVPAGRITVFLLALVAVVALGRSGLGLVDGLVQQGVQGALAPTRPVGATQQVAADSTHPDLAVTVAAVTDTRVPAGKAGPPAGERLVAVPLVIADRGDTGWTWSDSTRITLLDEAGVAYAPTSRYRRVTAGAVLPAAPSVAAHHRLQTTAVFEVPVDAHISAVRFVVGPGLPVTLRWTLVG